MSSTVIGIIVAAVIFVGFTALIIRLSNKYIDTGKDTKQKNDK
jgi:hypothetical protein